MGRRDEKGGSKILPLTIDAQGKVGFDAVVRQYENASKIVYSQHGDLVQKVVVGEDGKEEGEDEMEKEIEETMHRTKEALEKIVNSRLSAAQPKNVPTSSADQTHPSSAFHQCEPAGTPTKHLPPDRGPSMNCHRVFASPPQSGSPGRLLDLGGRRLRKINTWNVFYADSFTPNKPTMWTEAWIGWFTAFGGPVPHHPVEDLAFSVAQFIQKAGSFINYYMDSWWPFHCNYL